MDISLAILNIYSIEGILYTDFSEVLEKGKSPKYRIKLDTGKRGILVQDLTKKNLMIVKCVREYYSMTHNKQTHLNVDCDSIKNRLDICSSSCSECHKKCIEKYNSKELYRI